jgi:copper chaperone CopZ
VRGGSNAADTAVGIATSLALVVLATSCVVSTGPEGTATQSDAAVAIDGGPGCHEHAVLELQGVTCPSCREVVAAALLAVNGVVSAQVSLSPPEADVMYCEKLEPSDLVKAVQGAGYKARVKN